MTCSSNISTKHSTKRPEQRLQLYEKIMANLLAEPNASKLMKLTIPPQQNKPKPIRRFTP